MHIERDGDGYVVHYAIADVAAFVTRRATRSTSRPTAAARRSTARTPRSRCTRRCSARAPASLLPDEVRPALLWTIKVDETGEGTDVQVERALVRSRAKLSYDGVQADLDAGRAERR